ncbi:MAG: hypothetical protein NT166_30020 [Candidatus Aminicenantes bacterium]|nr:hypothetical protein [Candidatus Aminicenantes bacterium]
MRKRLLIILSILLLNTFVFSEYPDQEEYQAQYYDNAKVLRVKYAQGETYVQRSYDEGFEEATVNLSIFEKDRVGTTEGRVEIYLGRLNFLRLDYDTEVEFERAPELRKTDMTLRIKKGGIYLDIQNLDNERDVEIQTPDCGVFLLNKGVYRIDVNEGGQTEVFVYEGLAEVSGDDYSRNVRENQKIVMTNGRVTESPFYFYASNSDEFDRWNRERSSSGGYARYGVSRYLANGYEDYEYELSRSGRWVYNNSYREYTWIPYNIGSTWRPYYNGRWNWNPSYGYIWNSYDSWGYFTHHYGRWEWDSYYGWYWLPGYHWSPAWVYWFWDNDYYGWCPVSRWNRPVIVINNHWNKNHDYRRDGIPTHSRSTVIIKKHELGAAHIDRVAVNKTTLRETNIAARGLSPKERPAQETVRVLNARGNTVVYKKGGFQDAQKYEAVKPGQAVAKAAKDTDYIYRESSGKKAENNAFKYSKSTKSENTESPRTFGREVKIEKKETPSGASSGTSYKSDNLNRAEKSSEKANEKSSSGSDNLEKGRPVEVSKPKYKPSEPKNTGTSDALDRGASSAKSYKSGNEEKSNEKSSSGSDDREKSRPVEVSKTQYKPSEPKKTGTSDALNRGSSSGTAKKVKEKEKDSPGFSPSERNYPSGKPSASDSSSSYRSSSSRYNKSSSETYVPSYRSKYPTVSEKSYSSDNASPRERISYSSYKSYAKPESSAGSSRSYSSPASSSSRYSSPSQSHSSQSSSSYSGSSSSHSSYSSPSSSHSSYSAPASSHSSHSASSSSGSHGSTAVRKKN